MASIGNELKNFATGVIAHLAIQTYYRVTHPNDFIVTERSVWVGDTNISTISKVNDKIDRLLNLIIEGAKKKDKLPSGASNKLDFFIYLLYLIQESTAERNNYKTSYKRYDIINFGTLQNRDIPTRGDVYEIKSKSGTEEGKKYVNKQVDKFLQYKKTLDRAKIFDLDLLVRGYTLTPGSWPASIRLLPVGPHVLMFWNSGGGVITYEWLDINTKNLKKLWEFVRQVNAEVRKFLKELKIESQIRPEVFLLFIGLSVVVIGLASIAAVEIAAVATAAAHEAIILLFLSLSTSAFASSFNANSKNSKFESEKIQKVFETQYDINYSNISSFSSENNQQGGLSGGTPPSEDEKGIYQISENITRLIMEFVEIQHGRGDEDFISLIESIRNYVKSAIYSFLSEYGINNLLAVFNLKKLDDNSIQEISSRVFEIGSNIYFNNEMYLFQNSLFSKDVDEAVKFDLPENFDEDGEAS